MTGPVRVVEIVDVDTNTCCGTHVNNTGHLQAVKLLRLERSKTGTKVFFVAGERVLSSLGVAFGRQSDIAKVLGVGQEMVVGRVEDLSDKLRALEKQVSLLQAEVVELAATSLMDKVAIGQKVVSYHRESADSGFIKGLATAMDKSGALLLTTVGSGEAAGSGAGVFMLSGPDELVNATSGAVAAALDGRGGGKGGRFQGKCKSIGGRGDAVVATTAISEGMQRQDRS